MTREEIEKQTQEFLENGGEITVVPGIPNPIILPTPSENPVNAINAKVYDGLRRSR